MDQENPTQQTPSTENHTAQTGRSHYETTTTQPAQGQPEGRPEQHHKAERDYWRVQSVAAKFGVIFAFMAMTGSMFSAYESFRAVTASQEGAVQARRAADEAHAQAVEAAKQTVEVRRQANVAERQFTHSLAADVALQTPNFEGGFGHFNGKPAVGMFVQFSHSWRNGGPGIALNVRSRVRVAILNPDTLTEDQLKIADDPPSGEIIAIPSQSNDQNLYRGMSTRTTQEDLDRTCAACDEKFVMYGETTFKDSLGNYYVKDFCGYLAGSDIDNSDSYFCPIHNLQHMVQSAPGSTAMVQAIGETQTP